MAKSERANPLRDRLTSALQKPPAIPEPPRPLPAAPASVDATKATGRQGKAVKVSVSLYPSDIERLDQIKAHMQQFGFRNLSDSEALRLACRAVSPDDSFADLYRQMQGEDKRRK